MSQRGCSLYLNSAHGTELCFYVRGSHFANNISLLLLLLLLLRRRLKEQVICLMLIADILDLDLNTLAVTWF